MDNKISDELQKLKDRITSIEHSIFGNGAIGMIEQISKLRSEIAAQRKLLIALIVMLGLSVGEQALSVLKLIGG